MLIVTLLSLLQCMNNHSVTIQMKRREMKRKGDIKDDCMLYCRSYHSELKYTRGNVYLMILSRIWIAMTKNTCIKCNVIVSAILNKKTKTIQCIKNHLHKT